MRSTAYAIAALVCLCLPMLAATWHVAMDAPNAADYDVAGRGSAAIPFKTIQAAVNAASTSDEIIVGAGIYDEGGFSFRFNVAVSYDEDGGRSRARMASLVGGIPHSPSTWIEATISKEE